MASHGVRRRDRGSRGRLRRKKKVELEDRTLEKTKPDGKRETKGATMNCTKAQTALRISLHIAEATHTLDRHYEAEQLPSSLLRIHLGDRVRPFRRPTPSLLTGLDMCMRPSPWRCLRG